MFGQRVMNFTAIAYALASAILFGLSTPAAKALLGAIHPAVLAGLLYCGAGIGVMLLRWVPGSFLRSTGAPDASLQRSDLPWLAGAVVAGGLIGPILLLMGLTQTGASSASLLLTLEGLALLMRAILLSEEHFVRT